MAKLEGPQAPLISEGASDSPGPSAPQAHHAPQAPQHSILHMPPLNWFPL